MSSPPSATNEIENLTTALRRSCRIQEQPQEIEFLTTALRRSCRIEQQQDQKYVLALFDRRRLPEGPFKTALMISDDIPDIIHTLSFPSAREFLEQVAQVHPDAVGYELESSSYDPTSPPPYDQDPTQTARRQRVLNSAQQSMAFLYSKPDLNAYLKK